MRTPAPDRRGSTPANLPPAGRRGQEQPQRPARDAARANACDALRHDLAQPLTIIDADTARDAHAHATARRQPATGQPGQGLSASAGSGRFSTTSSTRPKSRASSADM